MTLLKKIKEENKQFSNQWKDVREKGFFYYFGMKIITMGIMMLFIYLINVFLCKDLNYVMVAIIYIGITIVSPILSWIINELRYKRSKQQM